MSRVPWEDKRSYPVYVAKHYKEDWEHANSRTHGKGMADHPKYDKAKHEGSISAALSVVKSCLSHAYIAQMQFELQMMKENGFEKPVLVAPYRADSKNMLARTAAKYLGEKLGLEVETDIVEEPGKSRKKMDKLERVFSTPSYAGEVKKGTAYIAIDDMITTGGTLSELRSYIDSNGGRYLFACVMASPDGNSTVLKPQQSQVERVHENLGDQLVKWFENAKGSLETLTKAELGFLETKQAFDAISRGAALTPG